jgi:hypothetical protein
MKKANKISEKFKTFFYCHLSAEVYEPSEIEQYLKDIGIEEREEIENEFLEIINEKLWTLDFYNKFTGFEVRDTKALYEKLNEIYNYSFKGGKISKIFYYE